MMAVPDVMTLRVVETALEAGVDFSAASSAEWLESCSGVGGVVGSGTPSGQCLGEVSFFWSWDGCHARRCLPVVAVGLAVAAGRGRDGVLSDDGRGRGKEKGERELHSDLILDTVSDV